MSDADRLELERLRSRIAELERQGAAHRQVEEHSERRQQLLAMAVEAVREGVVITDGQLGGRGPRLLFVNDFFCELSGWGCRDLVGQTMHLLRDPEVNGETRSRMRDSLASGRPFRGEFVNRRRDGSTYLVSDHVSPVIDAAGALTHLVSIQQDITEQKRAERALKTSEERHRLLIERMNEGFVATDRNNRVDIVNARMAEMLGYRRDEMRGRYLGNFVTGADRRKLEEQEDRRHHGLAQLVEEMAHLLEVTISKKAALELDFPAELSGMGGDEAFREIRRICHDAKVVLASGFHERVAAERFDGQRPAAFLQKPFQPRDLIDRVRQVLADEPPGPAAGRSGAG